MPADGLVVEARDVVKTYRMGEIDINALQGISLDIHRSEVVAIMGPSGSGKSTLMNIIGCLDRPTSGEYILDGQQVSEMNDDELSQIRNHKVGFVFQAFNLLPRASALENVQLPLRYAGVDGSTARAKAKEALSAVGLSDRMGHRPNELSGGQQQRVAIARALVNNPAIILADEPTGALDTRSGAEIMDLLLNLNKERGTTVIIVTHAPDVAALAQRTIHIRDGKVDPAPGVNRLSGVDPVPQHENRSGADPVPPKENRSGVDPVPPKENRSGVEAAL